MGTNGKHPIIANGQYYIEPLTKRKGGGRMNMGKLRLGYVQI